MGNNNCIASGSVPHSVDLTIMNNTEIPLYLDDTISCEKDCAHRGFVLMHGKIVEGSEPPSHIPAFGNGSFKVSGKEKSTITPFGKVYYKNDDSNVQVIVTWDYSGFTSRSCNNLLASFSGTTKSELIARKDTPWEDILIGVADVGTWTVNIKYKTTLDSVKQITNDVERIQMI